MEKGAAFDADAEAVATFVPLGHGAVGFAAQLRRLLDDAYAGTVVLEPHYRPEGLHPERAAQTAVEAAQALLADVLRHDGSAGRGA